MSEPHLRKQDNCLNCGTKPIGRFCHHCGQENTGSRETVQLSGGVKEIEFNQKYNYDEVKPVSALIGAISHNFPLLLFVSLPFAALLLKLLYFRNKWFYYVRHGIFILHLYIFVFIMMLLTIGISKWENFTGWNWMEYVRGLLILTIFFYLYKAMRNFYVEGRGKTILKYVLFLLAFLFLIILLFVAFLAISFFQI